MIQRCPLAYPLILSWSSCLVPGGEPGAAVPCRGINNINNASCTPPHRVPQSHSGVKVQLGASFSSLQMMSSQCCISRDTAVGEIIDTAGPQTMSLALQQPRSLTSSRDKMTNTAARGHRSPMLQTPTACNLTLQRADRWTLFTTGGHGNKSW